MPAQLRRPLTWDQSTEMAQHARLSIDSDLQVYFRDPHSPWQRSTNENTNGLLRQYFPKGTDLAQYTRHDLDAVTAALNTRPRKTLAYRTPAEALDDLLRTAPGPVLRRPLESALRPRVVMMYQLSGGDGVAVVLALPHRHPQAVSTRSVVRVVLACQPTIRWA